MTDSDLFILNIYELRAFVKYKTNVEIKTPDVHFIKLKRNEYIYE